MGRSTAHCSARRCAWSAHWNAARWRWWLGAGVCAGLALLSKYSAVLTMAGAVLYLLSSRAHRHWLATPKPWLAALVALLLFAPVLVWNAAHDWVSFAFQAGRAAGMHLRPFAPLVTLAGEALFVLPWIWLPMMAVFVVALRRGPGEWRSWLLCCLAAPPIVVFARSRPGRASACCSTGRRPAT